MKFSAGNWVKRAHIIARLLLLSAMHTSQIHLCRPTTHRLQLIAISLIDRIDLSLWPLN
jgi:hypothetical protein